MAAAPKRRLAVLGGGLAGLAAAYEIASRSEDSCITVYQMGWRLGGKISSSRNTDPGLGLRIEEHGIHVLFGAYENLFYLIRRVYAAIGRPWRDAFAEHNDFTLMEHVKERWVPWTVGLPRADGDPGDLLSDGGEWRHQTPRLTADLIGWLRDQVFAYFAGTPLELPAQWFFGASLGRAHRTAHSVSTHGEGTTAAKRTQRRLLWHLRANLLALRMIGWIGHLLWFALRPILGNWLQRVDSVRRLWIAAELGVACAAGLTRAAVDDQTREDLDQLDLRDWLTRNGVFGARISPTTSRSAPLRMVYEVVFGYRGGDTSRPALAAGTGVRDLLRLLLDRRGALAYTMRAGSAETIVTPLYRALRQRQVQFEFFHRVDRLELSADGRRIERIHCTRQAQPKGPSYDPLIEGDAWPDRPKYALLVNGVGLQESESAEGGRNLEMPEFNPPTAVERLLQCGEDFDEVVLAIPVEALRDICQPLAEQNPDWRAMLDHLKTTPTQSVQLWFSPTAAELGWQAAGTTEPTLLGGYAQPLGNWIDLSVTLSSERWRALGLTPPGSVAYLCGPLAENVAPRGSLAQRHAYVRQTCETWLARHARLLWPAAFNAHGFDRSLLVAPHAVDDAARYAAQYFRANTNPSERYTLTLPGTTQYRLAPGASRFDNLILAGDWTLNGFDVGSVEATAMSGRLAARAVLGLRAKDMPVYGEAA